MTARKPLAGLIYNDSASFDAMMRDLVTELGGQGVRLGGLAQRAAGDQTLVTLIDDGRTLDLMQDLGQCAEGCRLNPQKLSEAAGWLAESLSRRPDLLLISRFARFEAEGGGYLQEIGAAAAQELPCLVGVSHKFEQAWRDFSGDCAESFDADLDSVLAWWRGLSGARRP